MRKPLPSQKYLKECLRYEPDTGKLFWKKRPLRHFGGNIRIWKTINTRHAGKEAFTYTNPFGHRWSSIGGENLFAHRVIWKMVIGCEPPVEIDHKNRVPDDNRWKNLRAASNAENQANKTQAWNSTGSIGVRKSSNNKTWEARIHKDRVYYHLGTFSTKADAINARAQAARSLYGEFAP